MRAHQRRTEVANKASKDNIENASRPPDARFAVQTIRDSIEKKKAKIASVNGEIGDIWAKIESRGVNKKAAQAWAKLDKLEPDERADWMRSFNLLCDCAGWDEQSEDLADRAEGKVTPLRVVTGVKPEEPDAKEPTDKDGFFDPAAGGPDDDAEDIEDDVDDDENPDADLADGE
jgi:uncharacterized protein (UPF0335 family)